jgi:hypothetical protein
MGRIVLRLGVALAALAGAALAGCSRILSEPVGRQVHAHADGLRVGLALALALTVAAGMPLIRLR